MPSEPIDDPGIPALLSHDRMTTYLAACGGDPNQAVRLYSWNVAVSSAFWGGFNVLEVALRNAIHTQLTALTGRPDWWNAHLGFHPLENQKITEALRVVNHDKGNAATPGHVVAELNFGFWTALLANRYHQRLWVPALQHGFPHLTGTRRSIHMSIERLRKLRNRAAHHEPVFARNLADDQAKLLAVLDAISPAAKAWVAHDSRVPQVLSTRQTVLHGQQTTSF